MAEDEWPHAPMQIWAWLPTLEVIFDTHASNASEEALLKQVKVQIRECILGPNAP
jgi:hypothetical protein